MADSTAAPPVATEAPPVAAEALLILDLEATCDEKPELVLAGWGLKTIGQSEVGTGTGI
jgi:hypothetical protein